MNLPEILGGSDLKQDDWSYTNPLFGPEGQLKVVGYKEKILKSKKTKKLYVLHCSVCAKDTELFGEGFFGCFKYNLLGKGILPCGCGKSVRWTHEQYTVKCKRASAENGLVFIDFLPDADKEIRTYSEALQLCCKHGLFKTKINALLNNNVRCKFCYFERVSERNYKDDAEMIEQFEANHTFPTGTTFSRSQRRAKDGRAIYWDVYCPLCVGTFSANYVSLKVGCRPCNCSRSRQKFSYIHLVKDDDKPVAVKFGISQAKFDRLNKQKRSCIYSMSLLGVWEYDSVSDCRKAELECMRSMDYTSVLSKEEMPDGYTETTYPYNIDKIIKIFEEHGGTLCQ